MNKFTNNAVAALASSISNSQTSITVQTGQGSLFPTISAAPGSQEFCTATLYQYGTAGESNHEIVKVTGRSGDSLTVVRGYESTTPRAFNAGDPIEIRVTADALNNPNPQSVRYAERAGFEAVHDLGSSGAAKTIPFDAKSLCKITLNNSAPTLSLPTTNVWPGAYRLLLFQDATGNRVPTWPQVPDGNWVNDAATPQPRLTAAKLTIYDFVYDGSAWYGGATPVGSI